MRIVRPDWEMLNVINGNSMKSTLLYFFVISLLFSFSVSHAQISKSEKKALVDLYNSTNGSMWSNSWDLESSPNQWHGVSIENNHVVGINLHQNNLQGTISSSIADLKYLEELNLAFNKITGELPLELSQLRQLKVLKLEMNRLKGELSIHFEDLQNLEELTMFNNMLEGEIPLTIGLAKNLKIVNLSSNFFGGNLPKTFENLTNLVSLELFGNKLEGAIEADLSKLTNLSQLVLAYNYFNGSFPDGLRELKRLEFVQIQGNQFNSYRGIEQLNSERLVTFDSDDSLLNRKYKLAKIKINDTRMADTKFEGEN